MHIYSYDFPEIAQVISRVSYAVSIVRTLENIGGVITAVHCVLYRTWLRSLAELAEASLIDCGIVLVLIYLHGPPFTNMV